jgi:tetratricopeptide (TPR) repeat protein
MFGKKDNSEKEEIQLTKKSAKTQAQPEENKIVRLQQWVEQNSRTVMIVSIAVIAVTVGFFVIKGIMDKNSEEKQLKSSVALNRVLQYFSSGDYQKALEGDPTATIRGEKVIGLRAIADEYSGYDAGKIAALYAGNCWIMMNKHIESEKYFDIASGSDSKMLQMGAYAGLGAVEEVKGEFNKALKNYEKATELAGKDDSKFRYTYYSGLCYEKLGNKQKAEEMYRYILDEAKTSEFIRFAKMGLVRIGTIIE